MLSQNILPFILKTKFEESFNWPYIEEKLEIAFLSW